MMKDSAETQQIFMTNSPVLDQRNLYPFMWASVHWKKQIFQNW
jgi:hypothetical protein